ncbi:TonB-dependent siderophore receptor [Alteromonas aestuariivivens]|uniref:TonB-dependent siderophore receptor n=1 Tax=Alteromonas aestuariivivens TaxID=1938339 RepID=UPI0015F276F6|nr:TonB-dependent receptor plug domain-containing protein [Alteromonas aestuariivivens]
MKTYKSLVAVGLTAASLGIQAQESEEPVVLDTYVTEEVSDDLGLLQAEPVSSVFGFGKSVLETPRSVSSVSSEFIEEFNISSINDVATFVPGSFTTSFFGVAGSLDIRGTAGDNYFRGVKRLTNDGTYPTAIGASNRIDVIRGPMSPIAGPSRVGGAMNFVPKTARAETGAYLDSATGKVSYTTGSWNKNQLKGELGGPLSLGEQKLGYYVYGELEDSDSFYKNDYTKQTLLQAAFNMDLSYATRIEFGGMYQDWSGHENGGWNRVTADLLSNGTYITGQPAFTPDDTNNNGMIDDAEFVAGFVDSGTNYDGTNCWAGLQMWCGGGTVDPSTIIPASIPAQNSIIKGDTIKLDGRNVLIDPNDYYDTEVTTLYLDLMHETESGWSITNKLFFESVQSEAMISYGFAKAGDTWGVENQLIFAKQFMFDGVTSDIQVSPSIRHVDAWGANDYIHEVFDRVDLSVGYNESSYVATPLNSDDLWGTNNYNKMTQLGFAFLADNKVGDNLSILVGARYDYVDIEASVGEVTDIHNFAYDPSSIPDIFDAAQTDTDGGFSYNVSVSYQLPGGFIPYVTLAEQTTILTGVHDTIDPAIVNSGDWLGKSEMAEVGVKANWLDGRIFFAVAGFDQERVQVNGNAAAGESNEAIRSKGVEMELRYLVSDNLQLMASAAQMEVVHTALNGSKFSFIGASDVPQLDPTLYWGGALDGMVIVGDNPDRGGIPEQAFNLSGRYALSDELSATLSYSYVGEVNASPTETLQIPSYQLLNGSVSYDTPTYRIAVAVNNLLDETYFRANFPGLYGNLSILPERSRSFTATFSYKF